MDAWLADQLPLPGQWRGVVAVCRGLAESSLGLCFLARQPATRVRQSRCCQVAVSRLWQQLERCGKPVPVDYDDEGAFRRWAATAPAALWPGQVNLLGLRPLVRAELKWGLFMHTQRPRPTRWDLGWLRSLVMTCRGVDVESLIGFPFGDGGSAHFTGAIAREILHELRLVYYTPAETKDEGFIETDHFGVRFDQRASHFDLTAIPQRWLRDLVWDHLAELMRSPRARAPAESSTRSAGQQPSWACSWRSTRPAAGTTPPAGRRTHAAVRRRSAPP